MPGMYCNEHNVYGLRQLHASICQYLLVCHMPCVSGYVVVLPCIDRWVTVDLRTKAFSVPPQMVSLSLWLRSGTSTVCLNSYRRGPRVNFQSARLFCVRIISARALRLISETQGSMVLCMISDYRCLWFCNLLQYLNVYVCFCLLWNPFVISRM